MTQPPPNSPSIDQEPVRITGLAAGGDAVGRLSDGRVVFVEGALPGELVELEILTARRKLVRARVARVVEASGDRVEPPCVHFGHCGGCRWQHIAYPAQLEAKRQIVRDALERIGGLEWEEPIEIVASPSAYAYRTRARVVETEGRVGFRVAGSREIAGIEVCPVLTKPVESELMAFAETLAVTSRGPAPPHRRGGARMREWELVAGSDGPGRRVRLPVATGRASRGGAPPAPPIEVEVLNERLRASPGSFVQANILLWDALAREVCEQSGVPESGGSFVELYAGIGFLTLPLARAGWSGFAFESARPAIRDLKANLTEAGLESKVEVIGGRVEERHDLAAHLARADLLVMDPPRQGLEDSIRRSIADHGPARVVYVSCDPATLARDLRELVEAGYRLASVRALDLFPQTPHVEAVVRLERAAAPA